MSVTGKQLYVKFRELRPELSSGITSEILNTICDDPSAQPFLEWFYKNVSRANILSNEELQIKNALQNSGEWLEGEALDAALEEATRDCPDLLRLVSLDNTSREELFADYETLKETYREDEEYLFLLKDNIKDLREIEYKLDDEIEEARDKMDKEQIELDKVYKDCSIVLKKFDANNHQFARDVDVLLNIYADAAKNQGDVILWSQMPIDLFIKQVELYNHYLGVHIKKQFVIPNKEEEDLKEDSDYVSLTRLSDDRDKKVEHERMNELVWCKTNLANSKQEEINIDTAEKCYIAMLQYVKEIYNNRTPKILESSKMHDEILALSTKRDILEQNIELLRQFPEVEQFAEVEILKIVRNDALARLERRKARLEKLKNLHCLAATHGHVYVDLLCVLMEMQYCTLREVAELIPDARHYIATEYKLSSSRCEIMQQQQDEYTTLLTQSPKTCNVFNQLLISMILGDEVPDASLSTALKRYDDLIVDNVKKKLMLETCLNDKIDKLQKLENEVDKNYIAEIQIGPTNSLKSISYEIDTGYKEISATVQEVQADITRIRNRFKERMRSDVNLEREKDILWQRFLADPDTLRMNYEEAEQRANKSHFGDTLENNVSP